MKFLIIIFMISFLQGCSIKETDYISNIKSVSIPQSFFIKPEIPEPISKEQYYKLTSFDKEKELTLYIIKLYSTLHEYSLMLDAIADFNRKQVEVIDKINSD